jgi:hypothetical protein
MQLADIRHRPIQEREAGLPMLGPYEIQDLDIQSP